MKIAKKIIHIILWILVIGWIAIIGFDFYQVSNKNDPKLCLNLVVKEYDDGNMYICTGLGYKVYKSTRTSVNFEYIFGPFWIKEPTPNN